MSLTPFVTIAVCCISGSTSLHHIFYPEAVCMEPTLRHNTRDSVRQVSYIRQC